MGSGTSQGGRLNGGGPCSESSGSLEALLQHALPRVQTFSGTHVSKSEQMADTAWGWLCPGSRRLPHVALKRAGVAIGRGRDSQPVLRYLSVAHVHHETCNQLGSWRHGNAGPSSPLGHHGGGSSSSNNINKAPFSMGQQQDSLVFHETLGFVEVPDGRVSRLHCIVRAEWHEGCLSVSLEDCSSNGTFLNGCKLGHGQVAPLEDGDRISLVLSVAPLAEQYFVYRPAVASRPARTSSAPVQGPGRLLRDWACSSDRSGVYSTPTSISGVARGRNIGAFAVGEPTPAASSCSTSRYTTAEQSTLEDLQCQICLGVLDKCVAIEPCGHNWCATCLSHHFANQLQAGIQLTCPLRCGPSQSIVINHAVRALVEVMRGSGGLQGSPRRPFKPAAAHMVKPSSSTSHLLSSPTAAPHAAAASMSAHATAGVMAHHCLSLSAHVSGRSAGYPRPQLFLDDAAAGCLQQPAVHEGASGRPTDCSQASHLPHTAQPDLGPAACGPAGADLLPCSVPGEGAAAAAALQLQRPPFPYHRRRMVDVDMLGSPTSFTSAASPFVSTGPSPQKECSAVEDAACDSIDQDYTPLSSPTAAQPSSSPTTTTQQQQQQHNHHHHLQHSQRFEQDELQGWLQDDAGFTTSTQWWSGEETTAVVSLSASSWTATSLSASSASASSGVLVQSSQHEHHSLKPWCATPTTSFLAAAEEAEAEATAAHCTEPLPDCSIHTLAADTAESSHLQACIHTSTHAPSATMPQPPQLPTVIASTRQFPDVYEHQETTLPVRPLQHDTCIGSSSSSSSSSSNSSGSNAGQYVQAVEHSPSMSAECSCTSISSSSSSSSQQSCSDHDPALDDADRDGDRATSSQQLHGGRCRYLAVGAGPTNEILACSDVRHLDPHIGGSGVGDDNDHDDDFDHDQNDDTGTSCGGKDLYARTMSMLCPLYDESLPMDAATIKAKQVEVALMQLRDVTTSAAAVQFPSTCIVSLEVIARLAWSDDEVREIVAAAGGTEHIVEVMRLCYNNDAVQCNSCLALMALVRGEGELCTAQQWLIAKAGGVEAIVAAMRRFWSNAMVQLSALLCLIPLTLDNPMMQAHLCEEGMADVLQLLEQQQHSSDVNIATKVLVLLGVLMQGDMAVHDVIRRRLLESNGVARIARTLQRHGQTSEDVLWGGLFALAVLLHDGSTLFHSAVRSMASSGVLPVLRSCIHAHQARAAEEGTELDEMFTGTGAHLLQVLAPVCRQQRWRQVLLFAITSAVAGVSTTLLLQTFGIRRAFQLFL